MYQTLYRKYRPSTFDKVIDQKVIVQTLKNAIINKEISHAYMFFGPRGTGKTSIAKLFARTVNCLNPTNGIACDSCDNCNVSRETECIDIIEMDAASNNGVDEIRELRNKINLVPASLKYKVYIIDEVHMLTTGAFNALLKTLEEPPKHIIFILATTDSQKVPETIISRCQCFHFNRISEKGIVTQLSEIAVQEKIDIMEDVLIEIARSSDGGMRDALGMLDKLKSYTKDKITMHHFSDINGLISKHDLKNLTDLIITGNIKEVLLILDEISIQGKNIIQIMIQLLNYLRDCIIENYKTNSNINNDSYIRLANLVNEKMFDIKRAENPKIFIEIMLVNYMGNDKIISREIISNKKTLNIEKKVEHTVIKRPEEDKKKTKNMKMNNPKKIANTSTILNIQEIINIRVNNVLARASKTELDKDKKLFNNLKEYAFDQKFGYLVCELLAGKIRASSEDIILISYEYESMVDKNIKNIEDLTNVIHEILNLNKSLVLITDQRWEDEKKQFITNKKNGITYEIKEEPEKEYKKKEEENSFSEVINLFGDIIEVE